MCWVQSQSMVARAYSISKTQCPSTTVIIKPFSGGGVRRTRKLSSTLQRTQLTSPKSPSSAVSLPACHAVTETLLIAFIQRCSPLLSRLTALACDSTWVNSFFIAPFLTIHRSGVLTALVWLVPHESAAVSAPSVYNHTTMHHITSCKATYVRCMRV